MSLIPLRSIYKTLSSSLRLSDQQVTMLEPSNSLVLILFSSICISFLIKYLFFNKPKTLKNLPPSPPKLPIIGNLHQLGRLPHRSLQKLSQRYGPVMLLSLGSKPLVVVSSSEAAREILKTHDVVFANRPAAKINNILLYDGKDLAAANHGPFFRHLKSISMLQLLSKTRVQLFRGVREEETQILMENIREEAFSSSGLVNLSEFLALITNNVVSRAAFSKRCDDGESGKKFRKLLLDFFELLGAGNIEDFIPWLSWVIYLNGKNAKAVRVAKELDEFIENVVEERLQRFEREGENDEENKKDFVDTLIGIYKDEKAVVRLDRENVKALVLDMFAAGTDTTSALLEWVMTELLRQPRIMKKLQDEVRGVANGKLFITEDDLEKMQYLKLVIKETLRYHTPIPLLVPHSSSEDVKILGYDIKAGTTVMINAWAIARDPLYWDEPEEFRPERFMDSERDFKGHDFEFIPFGSGRRGCPGIPFALSSSELVVANIVHKFDLKLPNGMKGEDLDMTSVRVSRFIGSFPSLLLPLRFSSSSFFDNIHQ